MLSFQASLGRESEIGDQQHDHCFWSRECSVPVLQFVLISSNGYLKNLVNQMSRAVPLFSLSILQNTSSSRFINDPLIIN